MKKLTCVDMRKWMYYPPGALTPEEKETWEKHLTSCEACRSYFDFEKVFAQHLRAMVPREQTPQRVRENILSLVRGAKSSVSLEETKAPSAAKTADLETGVILGVPTSPPESRVPTEAPPVGKIETDSKVSSPSSSTSMRRSTRLDKAREYITRRTTATKAPETTLKEAPVKDWDRYQFVSFLGKGGMGKVYKAYDPLLARYVALKFIRSDSADVAGRFIMEAQAQARVEHKNVCKVYEVGEIDEKLYIAMQYIQGNTLGKAAKEMTREQLLNTFVDVCEAIHAAHRTGLIHRDIKPANVMVENIEGEGWHPYVMDFGLAREVQAPGLTQHGLVVGSPWYMSPEQARGENQNLDRRTDVYSLGATLYELLTGKPPFEGESSVAVLWKVIDEDPEPVRKKNPTIPDDLEIIVMKCLEKDPQRRYDSAKALAEDLRRFLNDEPILARRASRVYRLKKQVKKHKTLFAVTSVAAVLVLTLAATSITTMVRGNIRTRFAQRFGQAVQEIESAIRLIYMLPAHDIREDRRAMAQRVQSIQSQANTLGSLGRGPALYAAGRAFLSMQRLDVSLSKLSEAWNQQSYREPQVAYALGRTYGEIYIRELDQAERIENAELRQAAIERARQEYRSPARKYLKLAVEKGLGALTEPPMYVQALLAFYEGQYERAVNAAQKAVASNRYLYEAQRLEGDVYTTQAFEYRDRGQYEKAEEMLAKAFPAFAHAIEIARSDPAGYVGTCRAWNAMLLIKLDRGLDPNEAYQKALDHCNQALVVDPNNVEARNKIAYAYLRWAYYQIDHGQDPTEFITKAVKASRESVNIEGTAEGFRMLGTALWMNGLNLWYGGGDPKESMKDALKQFEAGHKLSPRDPDILVNMGNVYGVLGDLAAEQGQDPEPMVKQAVKNYKEALQLNPNIPEAYSNIGKVYNINGQHRMLQGQDPMAIFGEAEKILQQGILINPKNTDLYENLGVTYWLMGRWLHKRGQDPTEYAEKAVKTYRKSLEINPESPYPYINETLVRALEIEFAREHGRDLEKLFEEALKAFQRARELNPGDVGTYCNGGLIQTEYLAYQWLMGKDLEPLASETLKILQSGVDVDPNYAETYLYLTDVRHILARQKLENGRSPEADLKAAQNALESALKINPDYAEAYRRRAENGVLRTEWLLTQGKDPTTVLQDAKTSMDKALQIDKTELSNYLTAARVHRVAAQAFVKRHVPKAQKEIQVAEKYLTTVLQLDSTRAAAFFEQGLLYRLQSALVTKPQEKLQALDTAFEKFQKAETLNPHLKRLVTQQQEEIHREQKEITGES